MEERPDGSFRVYLANGKFLTVRRVDDLGKLSREAAERSVGKLTDKEWANFRVHGAFTITWSDGRQTSSYGLIRLVNGEADSKTLRHEMLHAARSLGLITPAEWRTLVEKYAPESKSDGHAEERIAAAFEAWRGPEGLWRRLTTAINRLLSSLGVVAPSADTAFARLREGKVWSRAARPETNVEARARGAGDVRYSGDMADDRPAEQPAEQDGTADERPTRPGDSLIDRWNESNPDKPFVRPDPPRAFLGKDGKTRTMTDEQYERCKQVADELAKQLIEAHDFEGLAVARGRSPKAPPMATDMEALAEMLKLVGEKARASIVGNKAGGEAIDPSRIATQLRDATRRTLEAQSRATDEIRPERGESQADFDARRQMAAAQRAEAREKLKRLNVGLGADPPRRDPRLPPPHVPPPAALPTDIPAAPTTERAASNPTAGEPSRRLNRPFPTRVDPRKLVKKIHEGGEKNIWEYRQGPEVFAVAIVKPDKDPRIVDQELETLDKLKQVGVKVVEHARVMVGDRAGIIMDVFPLGSKKIVRLTQPANVVKVVGSSDLLNENSIADLQDLLRIMREKKFAIDDLQFLIADDGSLFVNDPKGMIPRDDGPSFNNKRMIELLIKLARKNIEQAREPS